MITGIYEFRFFWSKNGRFVTHMCFPKKRFAETPIFIVFFGCALFGPSCQKRKFWTPTQKRGKFSLITEKLIFEYFFVFLVFFSFFVFFLFFFVLLFFCVSFGGFKGHVRWPEGPPHLALNPPYLFFLILFCFCFFCFFFVFLFGGFKGQVRWAEGPPHLALNPPYLFVFICFYLFLFVFICFFCFFCCFLFSFWFLSFLFLIEKPWFSP